MPGIEGVRPFCVVKLSVRGRKLVRDVNGCWLIVRLRAYAEIEGVRPLCVVRLNACEEESLCEMLNSCWLIVRLRAYAEIEGVATILCC